MRILVIHSFYKPSLPSGENDVVLAQVELLRDRGHDVELWGPTSQGGMGIVDKARTGARVSLGRGREPLEEINRFRPDVIHVHNLFPNVGLRWLSRRHAPVVMSIHNYRAVCANGVFTRDQRPCTDCLTGGARSALVRGCYMDSRMATLPVLGFQLHLRRAIAEEVDMLVYTSELSVDVLEPRLASRAWVVLPNFVGDLGVGDLSEQRDEPSCVVLGRLSAEKGVDSLLRMWPDDRRLTVIGDGPDRMALERLAGPAVEFTGFVDTCVRDALLRGATALVLPSITLEADPVVVAQALSVGTPCVVRSQTASARLVDETPAIRAFEDRESLLEGLAAVTAAGIRAAAREFYESRWSAEAWLSSYERDVLATLVP